MYLHRQCEQTVETLSRMFGAVLVTGPRQVGKTTMLRAIRDGINYASLDDPILLTSASEQTVTFFKDHKPPLFIDEVQKAPQLFPQMKLLIDQNGEKGQFYLCGSQQFHMMKHVSESLSGRLGILTLLGLSLRERYSVDFFQPFLPSDEYLAARNKQLTEIPYDAVWALIHRGSMPELCLNETYDWQMFYGAYVRTYIERDIRELSQVGDEIKFMRFMMVLASRTGQLLNLASAARDVGISQATAEQWLSILAASHIVHLLQPYYNNLTSRAVKTPKLYFLDTGLAAYLTRWNTAEVLKSGAMAGAFFESFVIAEVLKSYYNFGVLDPPLYFYRDKEQREIDLLIEQDGVLFPLEIKKHADPTRDDIRNFDVLDQLNINRGAGGVICLYDKMVTLAGNDRVIPIQYL